MKKIFNYFSKILPNQPDWFVGTLPKNMLTDKDRIEEFAKDIGLKIITYTEPDCVMEDAKRLGAVESLCFSYDSTRGRPHHNENRVEFNFEMDKDGKCVGFSTDQANSFEERRCGKCNCAKASS